MKVLLIFCMFCCRRQVKKDDKLAETKVEEKTEANKEENKKDATDGATKEESEKIVPDANGEVRILHIT